jgi:hypothetical protein
MPANAKTGELFPAAPAGPLARIVNLTVVSVLGLALAGLVALSLLQPPRVPWQAPLLFTATLPLYLASWYWNRILAYQLVDGELRVLLPHACRRIPLAGLRSAAPDASALQGAWKLLGRKEPGAVTGRFYSRKLGRFDAYVTDPAQAVVLRWDGRCVVVSPARPSRLLEAIRQEARLPE